MTVNSSNISEKSNNKMVDKQEKKSYHSFCRQERGKNKELEDDKMCANGSEVERRLAKAKVAGSNPVSR